MEKEMPCMHLSIYVCLLTSTLLFVVSDGSGMYPKWDFQASGISRKMGEKAMFNEAFLHFWANFLAYLMIFFNHQIREKKIGSI